MEIRPGVERRYQVLVAGQMREQAQLDLRVVRRQEELALSQRHEATADLTAEIGAHRDVLQVRIGGGKATGCGDRLVELGVHAAVDGPHAGQGVDVGVLDLRELAVAQDEVGQGMDGRQLREHLGIGGVPSLVLLHRGQLQHLEEDVGQLLGRTQVERLAGQFVNLGRETVHLGLGLAPQRLQTLHVDGGAHALHDGEHPHERQVDVGIGVPAAVLLQRLLQEPLQQSGRRGADGRALGVGFGLGQSGGRHGLHERVVGVGGK